MVRVGHRNGIVGFSPEIGREVMGRIETVRSADMPLRYRHASSPSMELKSSRLCSESNTPLTSGSRAVTSNRRRCSVGPFVEACIGISSAFPRIEELDPSTRHILGVVRHQRKVVVLCGGGQKTIDYRKSVVFIRFHFCRQQSPAFSYGAFDRKNPSIKSRTNFGRQKTL